MNGLTKRKVLHQTLHIGCNCHGSNISKPKTKSKSEVVKKFVPRRPYNVGGKAKNRASTVGRVVSAGADPLAWSRTSVLPEMRKIESMAERTLNIRPPDRQNLRGGKMF